MDVIANPTRIFYGREYRAIFTIGKKQESLWLISRIIAEFITDAQHRRSSRLFSYLLHILLS